jgi:carbamoyl-phosphate synthase large subunit
VARIGYPALLRPSYVLGGRAMEIVYDEPALRAAMKELAQFGSLGREGGLSAERPVLIDRFLEDATEVDVDAIRDHTGEVLIGGVMEHVEEAGVHSGDSACSLPPYSLSAETIAVIEDHTCRIASALDVRGLLNVQFAVTHGAAGARLRDLGSRAGGHVEPGTHGDVNGDGYGDQVFVIEANPRASRTVPFVAKATGVPLVKVAARVMVGATLAQLRDEGLLKPPVGQQTDGTGHVAVKEAVLPFNRFPDVDTVLGPEMRSTGEVMGIDRTFGLAFAKAQVAAGDTLPSEGTVFLSLADRDKRAGVQAALGFVKLGFDIAATSGTARFLEDAGVPVAQLVAKVMGEGNGSERLDDTGLPTAVDLLAAGMIHLVVNSPRGRGARADGRYIRLAANVHRVPCLTTASAAVAAAEGMLDRARHEVRVGTLQEHHAR